MDICKVLQNAGGKAILMLPSGQFAKPGTPEWHARMREAFAAIDRWELESEGAQIRPRIHLTRAQSFAHLYPVDSSDSTNVAMNHSRQLKKSGETVAMTAARVDARIQASAGPEAEHQAKRPLLDHLYEYDVLLIAKLADRLGYWPEHTRGRGARRSQTGSIGASTMTKNVLDPSVHKFKKGRPAKVRPPKHFERPVQRDINKMAAILRAKFNRKGV